MYVCNKTKQCTVNVNYKKERVTNLFTPSSDEHAKSNAKQNHN